MAFLKPDTRERKYRLKMNKKPNTFVVPVSSAQSDMEPNPTPQSGPEDRIIDAAVRLYAENRDAFRMADICEVAGVDTAEAESLFETKAEILRAFYRRAFSRYAALEGQVPDFSAYSLAEKVATLTFSYADEISYPAGFAAETFGPLMLQGGPSVSFEKLFQERIAWYIGSDPAVSDVFKPLFGAWAHRFCAKIVLGLIRDRLTDKSPEQERSAALVDKVTMLMQTVFYAGTLDRLWDLGKYLYSQRNVNKD